MGETVATLTVRGAGKERKIKAVVDTGATNTTLDRQLAKDLGIIATDRQEVVLANGRPETVGVGSADVEIEGVRRVVPVFIHGSNLVGLTTLEAAGLRVNPITRELEHVPGKLLGLKPTK